MTDATTLPRATSARWQPLRSGLVNLYKYDDEEFRFEQGNLLWRGNNGAGKSRALALQLPFLLDGQVAPHRLEPDGDASKSMAWNLLMDRHDDRQGYTWLELGRRRAEGEHYLTLGCGLKAVRGRRSVESWFFVTPQRIGRDLFLVGESRCTPGRRLLEEALGSEGRLFTSAKDYRKAVDAALFGLGDQRYEALINLLIQLRKPQLSRTLEEGRLSGALSEALAPLSDQVLADVGEAFRELESDRDDLDRYQQSCASVDTFLADYRRYAGIAARQRAKRVCSAHAQVEAASKALRAGERSLKAASQERVASKARVGDLELEEGKAEQRVLALRESPEMRAANELVKVKARARELEAEALEAEGQATSARDEAQAQEALAEKAEQVALGRRAQLVVAADAAAEAAVDVGLSPQHAQAVAGLTLPDPAGLEPLQASRQAAAQALAERRGHAEHLRGLDRSVSQAEESLSTARTLQQQAQDGLDDTVERRQAATQARTACAEALLEAFLSWGRALKELPLTGVEALTEQLEAWVELPAGGSPVQQAAQEARDRRWDELAQQGARLTAEHVDLDARREALELERSELESGRHAPPAVPPWRDPATRIEAAGAPLWRVVDFVEGVDDATQSQVEAALEASGLLDAWISPDGRLLTDRDGWAHDAVLAVGRSPEPPANRSLTRVLRAAIDPHDAQAARLDPVLVERVLAHVGFGAETGTVWVDGSGRYQVGPLHGAWTKERAEHIGAGARQARRRRRLAELADELAAVASELEALRARLAAVEQRRASLAREHQALPGHDPVRQAAATLEAAEAQVRAAREAVAKQEALVIARREAVERARDQRRAEAAELGLSAWIERARELERALARYERDVAALWPEVEQRLASGSQAARERAAATRTQARAEEQAGRARRKQVTAAGAAEQAQVLEETVGASAREVEATYRAACARQLALRGELAGARDREGAAREAVAKAEGTVERLELEQARLVSSRDETVGALRRFAEASLLGVALAEPPAGPPPAAWSLNDAVAVARQIERGLSDLAADDESWKRVQREIQQRLQELITALLPHGYQPAGTLEDNVLVVTIPFQGAPISPAELQRSLADEVEQRQGLLTQREREVIENHLIGEVALHLHDRLHEAERLVADMNTELEQCTTSAGMELRLVWEPAREGPAGLSEARRRLLARGATWNAEDREALAAFLQQELEAIRLDRQRGEVTGTWHDLLRQALDYRAWHQFFIERRQEPGDPWRRLTRRTHGTGSGGEKAIALTIPQLAAAAAHYRSAKPHAPRLILLDEAFVGVDSDMRAKCMALLTAFDLNLVMTSEREWGCYPTLPGIAICQLSTARGVDAIHVARWVWNGRERRRDLRAPVGASTPAPAPAPDDPRQLSFLPGG